MTARRRTTASLTVSSIVSSIVRVIVSLIATAVLFLAAPPVAAVVGGQPAGIEDQPWLVALVDQDGYPFCDGTLTGADTVVTAAHCVSGRTPQQVQVVGGRTDLSQVPPRDSVSTVTRIDVPDGYVAPQRGDDIASLTLADPFPYRPLPAATGATGDLRPGTVGTLAGWGRIAADPPATTTVLHAAQVPVVAERTCADLFDQHVSGAAYDPTTMLCAGGTGAGGCAGDDGGPLVVDGRLAGVLSWTLGCGRHPDFYTRVITR